RKRAVRLCAVTIWLMISAAPAAGAQDAGPPVRASRLRRPVAAVFLADGYTLCVANRGAGSVSLVDLRQRCVRGEFAIGTRLTGLAALPDRRHVLVVDDQRHELVALLVDGSRLTVRARLPVGPYPVSIALQADGTRATVASLWSRRLEVVDLSPLSSPAGPVTLRVLRMVSLPFRT